LQETKQIVNMIIIRGLISIASNEQGLLLCWNFIMSSPEPPPIKKLMMKITTKS